MKTNHTPGPWKVEIMDDIFIRAPKPTEGSRIGICSIISNGINQDFKTSIANAKLIAAAPEMLELIQWISKVTNSPEIGIRCDKLMIKL